MKKSLVLEQAEATGEDGPASAYAIFLLYERAPAIGRDELLAALRERCGAVDEMARGGDAPLLHYGFPATEARFADGRSVPVQALVLPPTAMPGDDVMEQPLQQSWDWPEARAVAARCTAAVGVADFLCSTLHRRDRLRLFQAVVSAVLAVAPCLAIHWRPSQRLVEPDGYRRARLDGSDPLYPAVNARLFRVENSEQGDTVMDTLGLAALGVPDLQCHFRGLDCGKVAAMLLDSADYLFEHGDVIADGHTIQGLAPEQRWRCRHEDALVGPPRVVLDLDPGDPFAAGGRPGRGEKA